MVVINLRFKVTLKIYTLRSLHLHDLPIRLHDLPIYLRDLPIYLNDLPIYLHDLPIRQHDLPIYLRDLPIYLRELIEYSLLSESKNWLMVVEVQTRYEAVDFPFQPLLLVSPEAVHRHIFVQI